MNGPPPGDRPHIGRYNFAPGEAAPKSAPAKEAEPDWDTQPAAPWRRDFLELFLKNQLRVAPAMPILSLILALMSMSWMPVRDSVMWLTGCLGAQAVQLYLCSLYFKRRRNYDEQRDWVGKIAASELLIGASWIAPLFIFWDGASAVQSIYLVAAVMAAIAVRLLIVNSFMPVLIAGTGIMTLGVAVRCATQPDALFLSLASMIITLEAFFLFVARQLQDNTRDMLIYKAENHSLIDQLRRERDGAEAARHTAEEANKAKSAFLATMSHELRTPLNAILGFSEILKGELFGPMNVAAYKTYAGDIHHSGGYLLALVNDILDLSRIEAGRRELDEEPLVIAELVEDARYLLRVKSAEKNISVSVPQGLPLPKLLADRRAVSQVLINLLTNAVKFTPQDGKVAIDAQSNAAGGLDISVSDNGPGIPAQEIEAAMRPFARGSHAAKKAVDGAGLGLSITKGLMELHGGALAIRSAPGEGATVTVTFPPRRVLSGPRGEVLASPSIASESQRKLIALTG